MGTPGDATLQRLVALYRTESAENLAAMEQALLALERSGRADPEPLQSLLRAAHTLKGNSAAIGFEAVTQAAHVLEDQLEGVRTGTIPFSPDLVTELLEGVDALRGHLRAAGVEAKATAREATLRVNVARLDALLDLTAEITIARGRLGQLVGAQGTGDTALGATLWHLEQLHGSLQEEVMKLRMVPLAPSFEAQHRTVRDVAHRREKQVRLVVEARDVEVDTSIAEQIRDPLTHMVRNAVDHGIEASAERKAMGKDPCGTVTLRASHRAGMVVIELSDDGRGLDRARIAAKAEAMGLASETAEWTDAQVFGLIFEPGFSTAAEVTAVSGRGVGMDVVRRNIRALRGTIDIASTPGKGSRFTIRLPLTVAIISGFSVVAGGETYVLPLEAVEECLGFSDAVTRGAETGLLNVRGAPVPYARLCDVWGGMRPTGSEEAGRESVVVVRHGDQRVGLVVDRLEGDCQAVIKPLDGALQQLPGIAGSTILGNGRVALILNVAQLAELMTQASQTATGRTECCVR